MNREHFATDEEIRYASSILLKPGECFLNDAQKVAIIRSNVSRDVKASPGSGKTTVLLAKLIILANRMPLADGRGICVLTHTNVAIDEIKSKLGAKSDVLFRYPNFFGTIQSFVDRYFAIPQIRQNGQDTSIHFEDTEYNKRLLREFEWKQNGDNTAANWIYAMVMGANSDFSKARFKEYLKKSPIGIGYQEAIEILKRLNFIKIQKKGEIIYCEGVFKKPQITVLLAEHSYLRDFFLQEYAQANRNTKEQLPKAIIGIKVDLDKELVSIFGKTFRNSSNSAKAVIRIFRTLRERGLFRYAHAFDLAIERLVKYPSLVEAVTNRFSFVFLDEVQDTNKSQLQLLANLFDPTKVTIQKFGDPHQAIFDEDGEEGTYDPINPLPIDASHRFGENIAKILRTVCVDRNQNLKANESVISLKPIVLVFKDPAKVIPRFGTLITEGKVVIDGEEMNIWEVANKENKPIKAIGHVSKNKEGHLTIPSYFSRYEKPVDKTKFLTFDSLLAYLPLGSGANLKQFYDQIMNAILRLFNICKITREVDGKIRHYSGPKLLEALQDNNPQVLNNFRECISVQFHILKPDASKLIEVHKKIRDFLMSQLLPNFIDVSKLQSDAISYLDSLSLGESATTSGIPQFTYFHPDDKAKKIEIATVHAVKGETHAATLYLETYHYEKYESEWLADQLLGNIFVPRDGDSRIRKLLKLAYVGMSRPRYLLCFAVHADRYDAYLKGSLENSEVPDDKKLWEIVFVD